jgi:bifunctional aspartokinase / homoserine dehydrogenase 1
MERPTSASSSTPDPRARWRVHKFGGSSVADAACMARVAAILEEDPRRQVAAVLSACRGVTDALLALIAAAERRDPRVGDQLAALRERHAVIATALLDADAASARIQEIDADCAEIAGLLHTVSVIRGAPASLRDLIVGFGEIWSTRIFTRYLADRGRRTGGVRWIDARDLIVVDWGPLGPTVRWADSSANLARLEPGPEETLIVTGFIARDAQGQQTTLGRNGSDFTGSIVGHLLDADEIHIWTDVDGVLSADPRLVPDATIIDSLSYEEAMELAYFGAKVIHPQTMAPAVARAIPIWIRNTFAPEKPGTVISARSVSTHQVKGITTIDGLALINVEGAGMIGVPGTAQRLFGALREHGISVVLISQASSEHSICFAVPEAEAARTAEIVRETFKGELERGQIQDVGVTRGCSILSVVGDGMAGTPGVAAKAFSSLANVGVNVRAIAQGSSERNISMVVDQSHAGRALGAVHAGFYLSPHTVSIGLVGPGHVGAALLDQIALQAERLARDFRLDLRVRGIVSSTRMTLSDAPIPLDRWREGFAAAGRAADLNAFQAHIHTDRLPHAVIIDCSASDAVAAAYPRWLADGIHVVTPNKRANSGDLRLSDAIRAARRQGATHYLYEATVGAGLPIIQTLRDLRETGDDIRRIEGILSGTLAYLFNVWDGGQRFSDVVAEAKASGYTEPDPRDDLSGMDVARKLIILGREMGMPLEIKDVELESLVPESMADCGTDAFMQRLPELDAPMRQRLDTARQAGRVLRYVGSLDAASRTARVGLVELERTHPFANINLTDNIVRFVTGRYDRNPLVVQGPGAGPGVTAAGVFADLLRVCAYLGARL